MSGLVLLLIAIVLAFAYYNWTRYPKGYPPHPAISLPIVGDLLTLGPLMSTGFRNFRAKYGDVFGLTLGPQRVVVLCNYELIHEASTREELCGRNAPNFVAEQRGSLEPTNPEKVPGVLANSGKGWQDMRRFSLHALRDLGYGKNGTEELIIEEINELCSFIESTKNSPIDARNKFNIIILNALWRISTSERLKHDDPKMKELLQVFDDFVQEMGNPLIVLMAKSPFLIKLAKSIGIFSLGAIFGRLQSFMESTIAPIKASYQEDSMRNFVDRFLAMVEEQEKTKEQPVFLGEEGRINLVNLLIDFFLAGSETTSTTLLWAMLFMIVNPDIQDKVHKELDEVVGKGNQPRIEDRTKMPYIEAVIHEIQRLGNISDRSVPHRATKDCYLSTGHFIPKDTMLFLWIGALMSDPKDFPEPSKFDPTRHLNKDGSFKPHPRVIPFGLGKRRCLGETLAKMELFLFFTGIMSRFRVETEHPGDQPTTKQREGAVASPHPFKMKFIPRL